MSVKSLVPDEALDDFPHLSIALLPTALHPLKGLRAALGPNAPTILVKRDDLSGLALGGNKARKLEYLLADARSIGADTVLTCGAAQSNHALQTAAAARRFGFDVECVLYGLEPAADKAPTGNLKLHAILKTPIRWERMQEGETRPEQAVRRGLNAAADRVRAAGKVPYVIPTGGSTPIGALGYVRAMIEARIQLAKRGIFDLAAIFVASGSGGTQAGMLAGRPVADWNVRIVGVGVDRYPTTRDGISAFDRAVADLAKETSKLIALPGDISLSDVEVCADYVGAGYGIPTPAADEAIALVARTEGIILDPVYTGKAMAGLLGWIREGRFRPDETVLFWHTGGAAGLFA